MLDKSPARERAEIARTTSSARRRPDDEALKAQLDGLKSAYRAARLAEAIRKAVDQAPRLSDDQLSRLSVLLQPRGVA